MGKKKRRRSKKAKIKEKEYVVPRCSDYDGYCQYVEDYVKCFLHDPIRGYCPYLRKRESEDG